MTGSELVVRSGQVVALRLFDLANEIDLNAPRRCGRAARRARARAAGWSARPQRRLPSAWRR